MAPNSVSLTHISLVQAPDPHVQLPRYLQWADPWNHPL